MRIGLIGLGRIGALHAQTLSGLLDVGSLVLCDTIQAVARQSAERLGAHAVDSPGAMLAAGVDGIVIAASTDAHPELIRIALDARVPVFCEKPLASTAAQSLLVHNFVADSGMQVQIGYPRRFDAGFAAARAAVAGGELGWLHTVRSTTLDPAPAPAAYIAASGGIFRDCSVHDFDAIRWVTGQEVIQVYATGANQGESFFTELGDVDTAATVLSLTDGTLALVSNSRYNGRGYDVRLEVHGCADSIAVGLDDHLPLRSVENGIAFPAGAPHMFFMDRLAAAFRAELAAFTDVVAGRRDSPCTVADALEASWIAEAATLSMQRHTPVTMAEVRP
jgi:myo-inositol 2-dehydrogenase/D-chiro-inositol 1-dehydrogenase